MQNNLRSRFVALASTFALALTGIVAAALNEGFVLGKIRNQLLFSLV